MSDLHFQVAGDDFISSLCHTGRIHSLTTLRPNPQVTVKAGLCLLQGEVHRDVFPFWSERERENILCLAVLLSAWTEREGESIRLSKTGLPSDTFSLPGHVSKD